MQIERLTGHRHLAAGLAGWHHAEFGHLYDPRVEPRDRHARAGGDGRPGSSDITWIAFDGDIADEHNVLGSVSLIGSDDLPGFEHLTPWLASLYVGAPRGGRRLGSALVDLVLRRGAARAPVRAPLHRRAGRLLPRPRLATARRSSSSAVIVRP